MLNVDEFESVFRAAAKERFRFAPPEVATLLVVTDLEGEDEEVFLDATRLLLAPLVEGRDVAWEERGAGAWEGVEGVLGLVDEVRPDLVVTYRNLRSDAWKYSYSLGVYLNALTRATPLPVFVTPHPRAFPALGWKESRTDSEMVINGELAGDDALGESALSVLRASLLSMDPEANPLRTRPTDSAPILATVPEGWRLRPLAIRGDWVQVSPLGLADRITPSGWVRWTAGSRLLVHGIGQE